MKELSEYMEELKRDWPALAAEIGSFLGLDAVLAWMQARGFPPGSVDIVAQDEFEHDFLVELEPGGRWLVFGVT
ncbi:MAG: hypothetical protein L0Y72_14310 [Gemmataceae bacterium]|nr:hypothetical protein [Gemmataceae bacterium]MCI0740216.1 hypothetical protein [Gemmataceae bacterium]